MTENSSFSGSVKKFFTELLDWALKGFAAGIGLWTAQPIANWVINLFG